MKQLNNPISPIYQQIKDVLATARSQAYKAVNFAMVQAYWNIGRIIVEEEQRGQARAEYGKHLLQNLSNNLTEDFGKGFDERNLRSMRAFYVAFPIWNAVRSELSWTHYRLLLKLEKPKSREFYINECVAANWSTRQLERQINTFYFERLLASQDKAPVVQEAKAKVELATPQDIIKDPYVLEFLDLQTKENRKFLESNLENAIIAKLQEFLLELGKGFAFVGRQYRISADTDHFYIDLVFYNYILKCFLLIDLKTGKLTHQDIGQMDFYVRYFEDNIRGSEDNPTIGLILCQEKNETIAKYSVLKDNKQLFASKYKTYLPTEDELVKELERERQQINLEK